LKKFTAKDVFGKRHRTLRTQLIEIKCEIEENWKFNGQLRVNLYKSKTNDQNKKKSTKIQGWCWSSTEVKLHKIKSSMPIRDAIERN
jgi:hypothetical protein